MVVRYRAPIAPVVDVGELDAQYELTVPLVQFVAVRPSFEKLWSVLASTISVWSWEEALLSLWLHL